MCNACTRMKNVPNCYDIIGDIHGRWDKLELMLMKLGYVHNGKCHVHSDGRKIIFLGDLVDPRGDHPNGTREVLVCVRNMVESGFAQCILGNHEYNFVAYHSQNEEGAYLRPHSDKNKHMHQKTHEAFAYHPDEIHEIWLPWMKSLPFFLDLPELRAVHACWHSEHLALLADRTLADEPFLRKSAQKDTPEYEAVEAVLKGVELPMPVEESFPDYAGNVRTEFRAKWWSRNVSRPTLSNMVFPPNNIFTDIPLDPNVLDSLPGYGESEKPLFIGHYYKPADSPPEIEASNLCCLDFSAADTGPLTAYRYDAKQHELQASCLEFVGHSI
jgi:hypothetical protein